MKKEILVCKNLMDSLGKCNDSDCPKCSKIAENSKERKEERPQGHLNRIEDAILALADYVESGEWKGVREQIRFILNRQ